MVVLEKFRDTIGVYENALSKDMCDEIIEELWNNNPCNITGYKNDTTWLYVELVASQLVDEYEDTTCQELSDESYEILTGNEAIKELMSV